MVDRLPHAAWSKRNDTCSDAARYTLTGIETNPNDLVPEPNERRAIGYSPPIQ